MSLESRLGALVSAIAADIKALFARSVPAGGTAGQVLAKASGDDHDVEWTDAVGGTSGPQLGADLWAGFCFYGDFVVDPEGVVYARGATMADLTPVSKGFAPNSWGVGAMPSESLGSVFFFDAGAKLYRYALDAAGTLSYQGDVSLGGDINGEDVMSVVGTPTGSVFYAMEYGAAVSPAGAAQIHVIALDSPGEFWPAPGVTLQTVVASGTIDEAYGMAFSPDGLKMVVLWADDMGQSYIDNFTLSSAWDITTATVSSTATLPEGMGGYCPVFSPDGTELYFMPGSSLITVPLTTPWVVATSDFTGATETTASFGSFSASPLMANGYLDTPAGSSTVLTNLGDRVEWRPLGDALSGGDSNNIWIGTRAGADITTGTLNVAVGAYAGSDVSVGEENVMVGYMADTGRDSTRSVAIGGQAYIPDGTDCIALGADSTVSGTRDHATAIGAGATCDEDNTVVLGRAADKVLLPGGLKMPTGAGAGKVLTSDADGNLTLQTPSGVTLTGTQTLTNKTISADNNTISGIAASSFVLSNASGNIDGSAAQKAIPSGEVVGTTDAQTLTNKTLTSPTSTGDIYDNGSVRSNIIAVAALNIDCSLGNYFTKTISGNSTFTFSNAPASLAYAFTLELTHASGTVTWPTAVQWPGGTAPTLATGKTHLFVFVTDDGGTRWRGVANVDYTN